MCLPGRGGTSLGLRHSITRISWVDTETAVVYCNTIAEARKLCANLLALNVNRSSTTQVDRWRRMPTTKNGMITMGAGLKCHVQWCSAQLSDLIAQQHAIAATTRLRYVRRFNLPVKI